MAAPNRIHQKSQINTVLMMIYRYVFMIIL
nr:MAG TPA: hypothetical protein [Caudoviricetes sp.]